MGNLDIETLERIDDFNPDKSITKVQRTFKHLSRWMKEQPTFLQMSFQVSKGRSSSWTESVSSTGPSIWRRDFQTSQPPSDGSSSTKDKEKETGMDVLRQPCRELQMKRPREGDELTDKT